MPYRVLKIGLVAAIALTGCDSATPPPPPPPATQLVVTSAPPPTAVNRAALATAPVVRLADASGDSVAEAGVVVTVALTGGGGTLSGTLTSATTAAGTATFPGLSIAGLVGTKTLTFSAPGLAAVTAQTTLTPGPATSLTLVVGNNQMAPVGFALTGAPTVAVTDVDGNGIAGVAVNFAVTAGGGSIAGPQQSTNAGGQASSGPWTLGATAGVNTLVATAAGLNDVSFTATAFAIVADLAVGHHHSCAVAANGHSYCWGANGFGELGDGTTTSRNVPTRITGDRLFRKVTAGGNHSCALTYDDTAYCWGDNTYGQVGDGTSQSLRVAPVAVSTSLRFSSIVAGPVTTCGITTSAVTYCWGRGVFFQIGDGTNASRNVPTSVAGGLTFQSVSIGGQHACGLTTTNQAYCWGLNQYGQVGDGAVPFSSMRQTPNAVAGGHTFVSVAAGYVQSCAVTSSDVLYCWGRPVGANDTSTPAAVSTPHAFSSVGAATSEVHACAVTTAGAGYCWGTNDAGRLGDGGTSTQLSPTPVAGGLTFRRIRTGAFHGCGLTTTDTVHCWGLNDAGQVGDGTNTGPRLVPVPIAFP
jgi:alpha-tubulin suppressor-like RCC1 family protein